MPAPTTLQRSFCAHPNASWGRVCNSCNARHSITQRGEASISRATQPSKLTLGAPGKTVRDPFLTWDANKEEEPTRDRTLPVRLDTAQATNTQPECPSQQVVKHRGKAIATPTSLEQLSRQRRCTAGLRDPTLLSEAHSTLIPKRATPVPPSPLGNWHTSTYVLR